MLPDLADAQLRSRQFATVATFLMRVGGAGENAARQAESQLSRSSRLPAILRAAMVGDTTSNSADLSFFAELCEGFAAIVIVRLPRVERGGTRGRCREKVVSLEDSLADMRRICRVSLLMLYPIS
jgi:hypothetical protein